MANEVAQLIMNHRSIRKYTGQQIPDEVLNDILKAAQWAATSNNFQAYSIIVLKDEQTKKKMSELCKGQQWIESCPIFLVFCIDYFRLKLACEKNNAPFDPEQLDHLIVGAVDTTLAVQNAYIAAKGYGLGGVLIGAVRKNAEQVSELLKLPQYVIPLVGLTLGYPGEEPDQKPRIPLSGIVHEGAYQIDQTLKALEEYEKITEEYYTRRTNGERTDGWSKNIAKYFSTTKRPDIKDFIIEKGFNVK